VFRKDEVTRDVRLSLHADVRPRRLSRTLGAAAAIVVVTSAGAALIGTPASGQWAATWQDWASRLTAATSSVATSISAAVTDLTSPRDETPVLKKAESQKAASDTSAPPSVEPSASPPSVDAGDAPAPTEIQRPPAVATPPPAAPRAVASREPAPASAVATPERTASRRLPLPPPLSQRTLTTQPASDAASEASATLTPQPAEPPAPALSASANTALTRPDVRPPVTSPSSAVAPGAAPPGGTGDAPLHALVATAPVPTPHDESEVRATLSRYAAAYRDLDADAAQLVWPSVDTRALSRAFSGLESQSLEFRDCRLDVRVTVARADCQGQATYVPKVGSRSPQVVAGTWSFQLRKVSGTWQIVEATTR